MAEGREHYKQIGQLQKALRERELHRLELEKENLFRLQRREKRHEQLRSKLQALHQELIQEEIESTQRVTLLLSQVDSVQREYELLEARTERLRQKKRQFELFMSSASERPTYFGTSNYGAHSVSDQGQSSSKFRSHLDGINTLRTSVQHNGQQFQNPFVPFSIPSGLDMYLASNKNSGGATLSSNVQGPMLKPYPMNAEYSGFTQMVASQNVGNDLGPSDHHKNSAVTSDVPSSNKAATVDCHSSTESLGDDVQINRHQHATPSISGKHKISEVIINDNNIGVIDSHRPKGVQNIALSDNYTFIAGSDINPMQQQHFSQPSSNPSYNVQALSAQEHLMHSHTDSDHYPQNSIKPTHHPVPLSYGSESHKTQMLPISTAKLDSQSVSGTSQKNQVTVVSVGDPHQPGNLRKNTSLVQDVSNQMKGNPQVEHVLKRDPEILSDQSHSETDYALNDIKYEASGNVTMEHEDRGNVPVLFHQTDEQTSQRSSFVGDKENEHLDNNGLNDASDEMHLNDDEFQRKKSVDDTASLKESERTQVDPVGEQASEVSSSHRSSIVSPVELESVIERKREVIPEPLDCDRNMNVRKSSTSCDNVPSVPKKNISSERMDSPSQDIVLSKSSLRNTTNEVDDNDSDFFDKEVPVTTTRAYKSLLNDMTIGGPGIPTESDSDDIEGQMSAMTMRETSVKKPTFHSFVSSIPSLRPKPPSTDTDSVDSVEAAIQAAMTKAQQEKQEDSDKSQEPVEGKGTSTNEPKAPKDMAKESAPVPAGGNILYKGITKPTGALNLKLDSDSESCGVSGGDNESEDDFDFYD